MSRDKFANERWEWRDGERSNTESTQMLIGNSGCIVYHSAAWAVSKADANLIEAAPDMYEALCDMISDRDCLSEATVEFARKAIAKARGESDNS